MPYKDPEKAKQNKKDSYNRTYLNDKQYHKDRAIARSIKTRNFIISLKVGKQCNCGEEHPASLDFHHINPNEKKLSLADVCDRRWSEERIIREINKCYLICSNCHLLLHHCEGGIYKNARQEIRHKRAENRLFELLKVYKNVLIVD